MHFVNILVIVHCCWTGPAFSGERQFWILWWSTVHSTKEIKNSLPKRLNINKHQCSQNVRITVSTCCNEIWKKSVISISFRNVFLNWLSLWIAVRGWYSYHILDFAAVENFTASRCMWSCMSIEMSSNPANAITLMPLQYGKFKKF